MIERNQAFIDQAQDYGVPDHMIDAFEFYVFHRIEPGSFLTAVLENNLMEAIGRADHINIMHLKEIASFVYNCIPASCHGSPQKVSNWLHPQEISIEEQSQ